MFKYNFTNVCITCTVRSSKTIQCQCIDKLINSKQFETAMEALKQNIQLTHSKVDNYLNIFEEYLNFKTKITNFEN